MPRRKLTRTEARLRLDELEREAATSPERKRELRHKLLRARRAVEGRSADVAACREALRLLLVEAAESPTAMRRLRHRVRRAKDRLAEAERAEALARARTVIESPQAVAVRRSLL